MPRSIPRIDSSKEVAYLTGSGNYTQLHYPDGRQALVAITLKNTLLRFPYLIRIHKQTAVNPDYATQWNLINRFEAKVRVTAGGKADLFAISRRRINAVRTRLAELQQGSV